MDEKCENANIKDEIIPCLQAVLSQNYFEFNNKYYKTNNGLAMGSPLSPLLAEVYMACLENDILTSQQAQQYIKFWYRYVHDIIIGFNGSRRQLDMFVEFINKFNKIIQFTCEMEEDGVICF